MGSALRHQIADGRLSAAPANGVVAGQAPATGRGLLGGRLGVRFGDRLDGSVVIYIGIDALFQ